MLILLLTLLDGSSVVLKTDDFALDFATQYGALTVPMKDVSRVDFAAHVDNEIDYARAADILGSEGYKDREGAMKFLKDNKRGAYKHLLRLQKDGNEEAKRRAAILLKGYINAIPLEDSLVTALGTFRGEIKNKKIVGKSLSLGELSVIVSQIASITVSRKTEVIRLSPNDGWVCVGYVFGKLSIQSSGEIDLWAQQPGQTVSSPNGTATGAMKDNYPCGSLIGRIGGKTFLVGAFFEVENMDGGELFLSVNGSTWPGAMIIGDYEVKVRNDNR